MSMPSYAVLALIPAIGWLLYMQVSQWRFKRFAHIPSKLPSNLLYGHLGHIAAEYKRAGSSTVHPDYVLENIWKAHGSPEYMFFDTRPVQYPLVLIASHEMAEQISKSSKSHQYSVTKSPTVQQGFGELVGRYSLISENGESWRGLRKTFNPGFAPQHLLSLLPVMIDKTYTLMDKLDALADSGLAAEMEPYCTNVTFDIIGEVVTNIDCKAQDGDEQAHDIVRNFKALKALYAGENGGLSAAFLNLVKRVKKFVYSRRLDSSVKKCIVEKFASIKAAQNAETKDTKDRSVLALALKDTEELTPFLLQSTADQVKSFLFAGHDTTAILLQRLIYALSIHPACLEKIRAEHDAIFGDAEPRAVFLAHPDETMKALKYTSACIKETLRLWPPAGSARMSHNGFKLHTPDGEDVLVDDCVLYLCHHIIQRDPKVYGETAQDFDPGRWVGDSDTSSATIDADGASDGESKVPVSAWRAFERGPRNCIGQELANIEARVILACLMRRYDFVKVGLGEVDVDDKGGRVVDDKGKLKTKSELINTMSITSRPIDGTVMRIEYRDKVKGGR